MLGERSVWCVMMSRFESKQSLRDGHIVLYARQKTGQTLCPHSYLSQMNRILSHGFGSANALPKRDCYAATPKWENVSFPESV